MNHINYAKCVFNCEERFLKVQIDVVAVQIIENRRKRDFLAKNISIEISTLENEIAELLSLKRSCFHEIEKIRNDIRVTKVNKTQAYQDLEIAKKQIDKWHRKSKSSFPIHGKSGKKLPKHSLIGQSMGDLESYKSSSNNASQRINKAKRHISNLEYEIKSIIEKKERIIKQVGIEKSKLTSLQSAYRDQDSLMRKGFTVKLLDNEYDHLNTIIKRNTHELENLQKKITTLSTYYKDICSSTKDLILD